MSVSILAFSLGLLSSLYILYKDLQSGSIWTISGVIFLTYLLIGEIRFQRNWKKQQQEKEKQE